MSTKRQNREVITNSSFATQKLGYFLAKEIFKKQLQKTAIVIALQGELGSGKTTFLQGFGRGLGLQDLITSPTFVIFRKFSIPKNKNLKYFYHFDCYRIKNKKEILELGFKEIVSNPQNIICIEWPEKIKSILPPNAIWLKFFLTKNKNRRKIILDSNFTKIKIT